MVHVTKSNYLSQLSDFLRHLPSSSFIAIDEEMTGIQIPGGGGANNGPGGSGRPNKVELPSDRYTNALKAVPERYSILQVGVALFHENPLYIKNICGGDDVVENEKKYARGAVNKGGINDDDDDDEGEGEDVDVDVNEHSYMHREGMLNTDELEDLTEREEEKENHDERHPGDNAHGDNNEDNDNEHQEEEEEEDKTAPDDDDNNNNNNNNNNNTQSQYISRIYNFYLFPTTNNDHHRSHIHRNNNTESFEPQREVTLNPSTIKFLLENQMDFDKVFREGIPFTGAERAGYLKRQYLRRHADAAAAAAEENGGGGGNDNANKEGVHKNANKNTAAAAAGSSSSTPNKGNKNRVKLTRPEDIAFVARTMASLREWIDSSDNGGPGEDVEEDEGGDNAATTDADDGNDVVVNNGGNSNATTTGLSSSATSEGTSLVLPPCNAFLRRCLYETVEAEYPGLILERADSSPNAGVARNQIRVIRLSPTEKQQRKNRLRLQEWETLLQDTIGFSAIFQAISDACNGKVFTEETIQGFMDGVCLDPSLPDEEGKGGKNGNGRKIPLVIHNGLMDLMFLLTHCHKPTLPESFEDTKSVIQGYFPHVYDTKVLSSEYSDAIIKGGNTALGELFETVCNEELNSENATFKCPEIVNKDGRSKGQAHEAAWDAYMTGCVFSALSHRILNSKNRSTNGDVSLESFLHESRTDALRYWLGLNKIYMHMSLYTIDLESASGPAAGLYDPLSSGLSVETTFHVSGITASVSTRDIFQALHNGNADEEELLQQLKYEIIWLDDASFFVGTKVDGDVSVMNNPATKSLIALHVGNKLYAGLGDVQILNLGDYFKQKNKPVVPEPVGIVGTLFSAVKGIFGLGRKRSSDEDDGEGQGIKRRRVA